MIPPEPPKHPSLGEILKGPESKPTPLDSDGNEIDSVFVAEALTELGATIKQSVHDQINIDTSKLAEEAIDLPNYIFFWTAACARFDQRLELKKHELKKAESQKYIELKEDSEAKGVKYTVDEIKARVTIDPEVSRINQEVIKLTCKRDVTKAMMKSLERKGFSLQLLGSMRVREEDWLRDSFSRRLISLPNGTQLVRQLENLIEQANQ